MGSLYEGKKHGVCYEIDCEAKYFRIGYFKHDKLDQSAESVFFHFGDDEDPKIKFILALDQCQSEGLVVDELLLTLAIQTNGHSGQMVSLYRKQIEVNANKGGIE